MIVGHYVNLESSKSTWETVSNLCDQLSKCVTKRNGLQEVSAFNIFYFPFSLTIVEISTLKHFLFTKVATVVQENFDKLKFRLPQNISLLFGLNFINHGISDLISGAEQEGETHKCPICASDISLLYLEEHLIKQHSEIGLIQSSTNDFDFAELYLENFEVLN